MKTFLFVLIALMSLSGHAGREGNGGSGQESALAGQQAQLEIVAFKLRSFFLKNESRLQPMFPEFSIQALVKKIKQSDIRIVDENKLIDKNGRSRTCLNFPESSVIECKYSDIESLVNQPITLFVLVFHEYLGLIGAEETSPSDPSMIAGYSISKRIAPFVSKVNDYDLIIPKKLGTPESNSGSCSVHANDVIALIDIQRSINSSLDRLQLLRNNSQNEEEATYYQVQIGILRAEYLKCDLFLTHALSKK